MGWELQAQETAKLASSGAGWEVNSSQNWPWEITKRHGRQTALLPLEKRFPFPWWGRKNGPHRATPCLGVTIFY